jgi:flagellar biosynthetic protein FliR
MSSLETFLVSRFVVFTLVLARTSALVMTAPIFGSVAIPRQGRILVAVTMSLLVTPVYFGTTLPDLENLPEFARLFLNEVLVGLLLGLGVSILFSGIQVAGQIVSQMSGLSLADVFDPGFDEEASVFSQLFYFLTLAVFVSVGGHRILTQALLETFAWAPPGRATLGDNFVDVLTNVATQSFALGIRASAPLLASLTLATLVLGLISRTLPQINIIAIGFGLSSLILLGILFLSIGAIAWAFQDPIVSILQQLQETVTYAN